MAKTNEFIDSMFTTERSDPELEWMVKEVLRTPTTVATVMGYDYFSSDRRPLLAKIAVPDSHHHDWRKQGNRRVHEEPDTQLTADGV